MLSINYLLCKWGRRGNLESSEEIIVDGKTRLKKEHAGIKVKWRLRTQFLLRPPDLMGTLLTVTDLVFRCVIPSFLTFAVHHAV